MDPITLAAWADEMEKISASVQELIRGAARMRGVTKVMAKKPRGIAKFLGSEAATLPYMSEIKALHKAGKLTKSDVRELFEAGVGSLGGTIVMPSPKKLSRQMASWGIKVPRSSRQGTHAAVQLHEQFERAVKPRNFSPWLSGEPVRGVGGWGHGEFDVLLKERNLRQRLTGKGSQGVKSVLGKMRKDTGEDQFLEQFATLMYGPRASQFFSEGSRMPRAMRKNLSQQMGVGLEQLALTAKAEGRRKARRMRRKRRGMWRG